MAKFVICQLIPPSVVLNKLYQPRTNPVTSFMKYIYLNKSFNPVEYDIQFSPPLVVLKRVPFSPIIIPVFKLMK